MDQGGSGGAARIRQGGLICASFLGVGGLGLDVLQHQHETVVRLPWQRDVFRPRGSPDAREASCSPDGNTVRHACSLNECIPYFVTIAPVHL